MITVIEIGQVISVDGFTIFIVIVCRWLFISVLNQKLRAIVLGVGKLILEIRDCISHLLIFIIHK